MSQLGRNKNNDFSTSTSTSNTIIPGHVSEEHILHVSNIQYHVSKYQEEKKKQKDFTAYMGYAAKKKAS